MLEDLSAAPEGSIVLLHACAHNPTGVDPTLDEWRRVLDVVQRRRLLPFFDMAYQAWLSLIPLATCSRSCMRLYYSTAKGVRLLLCNISCDSSVRSYLYYWVQSEV